LPAYDQVKVWTVEPTTPAQSRPRPRPGPRPLPGRNRPPARERRLLQLEELRDWTERNAPLLVWARLSVVVLLGGAMLWWPYAHSCGVGLSLYLAATLMIVVGGLWIVACTWVQRMARTHAVAILLALWGTGLILTEVLPRVGYARTEATWLCR